MEWLDAYEAHTVGEGRLDPSSPEAAHLRLLSVAPSLPIDVGDAEWVHSSVNNVWRIGELYLRLNFRGDRTRLRREATLLEALPSFVPHVRVFDVGEAAGLEWMLTWAAPGTNLAVIAEALPTSELRGVTVEFAHVLRGLHQWSPPPTVTETLREKATRVDTADALGIVAVDLVPVPLNRIAALVEPLMSLPYLDPGLVDAALERVHELSVYAPASSEYSQVIHGDAGAANILVDGARITTVMDFEFARLAPPDLELISFVRGLDAHRAVGGVTPPVLTWLAEGYPELFAHPLLPKRLWLYGLAFALETILFWPPDQPEQADLHPAHPVHALRRLVERPYSP